MQVRSSNVSLEWREERDAGCFYRMVRIRFYEKCTAGSSDHYSVIWNSWNDDRK